MGIKENAIRQFGSRAEAYSKGNIFVDGVHLSEIVKRSGAKKNHRVLDVATGAGFLALEFAKNAQTVIGCDITRNMLMKKRPLALCGLGVWSQDHTPSFDKPFLKVSIEKQELSGLNNTGFLLSDVESLPFPDESFDIVSCRFAFHHFPDPYKALLEMKRVCKKRIIIVDGVSSEDRDKSLFHNHIEELRDPSHVRIYALREMKNMVKDSGAVISELAHRDIPQDFEDWINRAGTDAKTIKVIEDLMRQSMNDDSTGLRVKLENGRLGFTYDTVILIADVSR